MVREICRDEAFLAQKAEPATKEELKSLHKLIKKVTGDIEQFSYNTSVSAFMICVNELSNLKCNKKEILEQLVITLAPFAPHVCEELCFATKEGQLCERNAMILTLWAPSA